MKFTEHECETRITRGEGEAIPRSSASDDRRSREEIRVLVVENEPGDVELVMLKLEGTTLNISVRVAVDVDGALSLLGAEGFDLVLLDLGLPRESGFSALFKVRAATRAAIIVLTGREEELGVEAVKRGAQEFVRKRDLDTPTLQRAIHYALARVRSGQRAGSYELLERHAVGAMGEVWRASHRSLARPAAVKFIRRQRQDHPALERKNVLRFYREAQAIASLSSPHTVTLFDFGVTPEGDYFYVMELLDGLDCERLVNRFGGLGAARAAHIGQQVAYSLAEAHQRGLVHRDVKPGNVMVCRAGMLCDHVKVLDFGIVAGHLRSARAFLGVDVEAFGTPGFVAPELAQGTGPDARADIYSMGCLFFYLLTGKHVFAAETMDEMIEQHRTQPPPLPSACAQDVPPAFDSLILRCLEKRPEDRYADCSALLRDLEQVEFAQPWTPARARRWWGAYMEDTQTWPVRPPSEGLEPDPLDPANSLD